MNEQPLVMERGILPSGHRLQEYTINGVLGSGSFGITYKAWDNQLAAWVAIKEYFPVDFAQRCSDGLRVEATAKGAGLKPPKGKDETPLSRYEWGLVRFLSEAQVLAQVKHPNVVRISRYFRAQGTAYIVMDYEEGEPLSQLLIDEGTLSEENVRGFLEDIVPALQAVHGAGFLHRDIKPDNLYVRERDGAVVLIDFGAARATMEHGRRVTALVTPGYSPPEQHLAGAKIPDKGKSLGVWSDIYSLGAVLYHCIVGRPPLAAALRLVDDTMPSAQEAGAENYSPALLAVVDRALSLLPENRFASVDEMAQELALRTAAESFETRAGDSKARRVSTPAPPDSASTALTSGRGGLWPLLAAVVILAGGGTTWWMWPQGGAVEGSQDAPTAAMAVAPAPEPRPEPTPVPAALALAEGVPVEPPPAATTPVEAAPVEATPPVTAQPPVVAAAPAEPARESAPPPSRLSRSIQRLPGTEISVAVAAFAAVSASASAAIIVPEVEPRRRERIPSQEPSPPPVAAVPTPVAPAPAQGPRGSPQGAGDDDRPPADPALEARIIH
ncbi:MAG: serine/threonine protein kinase, partial [Candidatus Competibacterales bacterium]